MTTEAFSGVGAQFKRGDGASAESFTAIAEVNNYDGPNMSREMYDATSLDSTDGYREFIPGFRDGGSITLPMNFTPNGWDQMKDDFESDDSVNYQIVLANSAATTFDFTGYVTELGLSVPADNKVEATVTIKITGPVEMTT